ncbi:MAG: hypothetical protein HOO67_05810 [Candidatus Peribacteraceae bacterium]|nr:hypothetical protein [Candidatus Peribacteraceae bacterium]
MAIFITVLLIPGVLFLCQIWRLHPLYTDSSVRESVRTSMTDVAAREGWLLSDMLVTGVTADHVRLHHREHLRGADREFCVMIALADRSLHSCDEKLS